LTSFLRRVAFLLCFFPLGIPAMLIMFLGIIAAGFAWLLLGPDEERTERLALGWGGPILDLLMKIKGGGQQGGTEI